MDKIEQLYNLYKQKGLITDKTSIDVFRQADKNQITKLYELGKSKGLFQTTDAETFSTAWAVEPKVAEPKKAQAVSTESPSDSAQEPSISDMSEGQETQVVESESSLVETDPVKDKLLEQEPNMEVAQLYDAYKEAGQITPAQTKEIRTKLESQDKGDRSIWEDIDAYATGFMKTGMAIPMYKYDTEEELTEKRIQKNKVDFLSALPEEKVKELNEYAVNRTVELNRRDTNILAENEILQEKARLIVKNLKHQEDAINQILDSGKNVPAEGVQAYEELYAELEELGAKYNENVDIIEADQEDVGDFYEELDLLKRNFGGLDYYKDVARLSTSDMIAGLMEFGISSAEFGSPVTPYMPNVEGHQFVKEFREEVSKQRELLRPMLAVEDIESAGDFGKWLAEQTATQLPVLTVLAASGGSSGLTILGASAGGQKMGALRDENDEKLARISTLNEEVKEMNRLIGEREVQQVGVEDAMESIRIEAEGGITLGEMKDQLNTKLEELEELINIDLYNPLEIYLAGTAFGLSEALSERVSLGILSKGKRALSAINKSGLTKEAKKGFGQHTSDILFSGFGEGSSEVGNKWAQNLVDILYLGKKDVHIFDGTEDALASGFALGTGMRATPTLIGIGGKAFMYKTVRKRVIANTNKIEQYMTELKNNPDISDEAKAFLQKKVDAVTKETQQDIVNTLAKLPEIGEKGIKRLIALDKKANGILDLVKEVEKTDLSEEVKAELKIDYKKQVDKILEEKDNILNPESAQAIVKAKEDGVKQETQPTKEKDAEPKAEDTAETTAKEEGTDKGAEGLDKVQGEDGTQPSVADDGKGVQQDSARTEGVTDGRTVDTVREELDVAQERYDDYVEAMKDGVTEDMTPAQKKQFTREKRDAKAETFRLSRELDNLEKAEPVQEVKTETVFTKTKAGRYVGDVGGKMIDKEGSKWNIKNEVTGELLDSARTLKEAKEIANNLNKEEGLFEQEAETTEEVEFSKINLADKTGLNKALEMLDNLDKNLSDFGKETLGMALPVVVLQGAVKAMKVAVKTAKTGADVISAGLNHIKTTDWYKNLTAEEKKGALKDIAQQLADNLTPKQAEGRMAVEQELDNQLNAGKTEAQAIASFETQREQMVARDILRRRQPVDQKQAFENAQKSYKKAQKEMFAKKSTLNFLRKGLRNIAKLYWDRQYLPKMILMKAGGKLIRNYMITMKGASGFAKYSWDKAYDKIYKGLSSKQIEQLDQIILQMRFIAIDKNREKRGEDPVVHPDFQNRQTSEATLAEFKERLGDKQFNDLTKRANAYFSSFKSLLDGMYESGIVTKEFRDSFFDVDYQPRVFLKFLTDQEQEMSIIEMGAPESASLGQDQIRKLEDGSNESLIVDSMYLLARSMNTRAKSNAMNMTTKKLSEFMKKQAEVVDKLKAKDKPTRKERKTIKYFDELASRVRENPIVGFTKSGKPKYKYTKKGLEKAQTYYKDGVKHQLLMEEAFFDQYNDNLKGFISNSNKRERLVMLSGTALVKTIATGNNPAFFLTNSPRDFMFISTFSEEYGAIVPVNMVRLAVDTTRAIVGDMWRPKEGGRGRFEQFVKHGGMLDFLHTQGKFKGTTGMRRIAENLVDNRVKEKGRTIFKWVTLNKLQMYSEIGFRMAVFNRSIVNQLKELGLKDIEDATKEQQEDIYTNATASARNTTDFSQGGIYTKDADALVPYLNAGVQGTRVAIENLHERPAETMIRMAQSAIILSAVPIAASIYMLGSEDEEKKPKKRTQAYLDTIEADKNLTKTERYLKALEGVSQYDKTNYQIYFTGEVDERGEYVFYRVSKPHFLTPLINYVNGVQEGIMKKNTNWNGESWGSDEGTWNRKLEALTTSKEVLDNVFFALEKNISPIETSVTGNITRNPLIKASLTYTTGYDYYRNQDLSYLRGKVLEPVEGHESRSVEQLYKNVGEELGLSPARMKGAVESLITTPSTSPFVGVLYGGLDVVLADEDAKKSMEDVRKSILKSVTGRVKKSTSEFNRRKDWDKIYLKEFSKAQIKNLKDKAIFKDLAKGLLNKEITNEEANKVFKRMAGEDVYEFKRMVNTFKETVKFPNKNPVILDLQFRTPSQRAIILADIFGDQLFEAKAEIGKMNKELKNELFTNKIMNEETIIKYQELVKKMK